MVLPCLVCWGFINPLLFFLDIDDTVVDRLNLCNCLIEPFVFFLFDFQFTFNHFGFELVVKICEVALGVSCPCFGCPSGHVIQSSLL